MKEIAPVPPVGVLKATLPFSPKHLGWVGVAVKLICEGTVKTTEFPPLVLFGQPLPDLEIKFDDVPEEGIAEKLTVNVWEVKVLVEDKFIEEPLIVDVQFATGSTDEIV